MEDSSEIGRDSFSNHKLEEVLKIQLITVTDKNCKKNSWFGQMHFDTQQKIYTFRQVVNESDHCLSYDKGKQFLKHF